MPSLVTAPPCSVCENRQEHPRLQARAHPNSARAAQARISRSRPARRKFAFSFAPFFNRRARRTQKFYRSFALFVFVFTAPMKFYHSARDRLNFISAIAPRMKFELYFALKFYSPRLFQPPLIPWHLSTSQRPSLRTSRKRRAKPCSSLA